MRLYDEFRHGIFHLRRGMPIVVDQDGTSAQGFRLYRLWNEWYGPKSISGIEFAGVAGTSCSASAAQHHPNGPGDKRRSLCRASRLPNSGTNASIATPATNGSEILRLNCS